MILQFKTKHNVQPTFFREKILAGVLPEYRKNFTPKIHTLRSSSRWRENGLLHMCTGVRTKQYHQFNKGIPELERCTGVQSVSIQRHTSGRISVFVVSVDGKKLTYQKSRELAINDGFSNMHELLDWLNFESWSGYIIHWTDMRY